MDLSATLAIIGFAIAVILTPIWLLLVWKGVRSVSDIRDLLRRPPRDRGA